MFVTIRPLLPVVEHTFIIYLFLVFGLRTLGRRQIGQLNAIDLVAILLLGSAVETSMIAGNTSLQAGLICASVLLLTNRAIHFLLLNSKRWRHLVEGGPILLVHDGHLVQRHLRAAGLSENDVLEAVRERGEEDLSTVRFAVLEPNGEIDVIPMKVPESRSKDKLERWKADGQEAMKGAR